MNRWIQKLFSNTRLDLHKQEYQELTLFYRIPLFGCNSSYLEKIFTKNVGENFNSYLDRVRIEHSKALFLEDNCRVYEISERVDIKM